MWALHRTGLELWFKDGTSLSNGYGVIQRFSEDLDLMVQHRAVARSLARIQGMFWGPRIPVNEACAAIREWIRGGNLE